MANAISDLTVKFEAVGEAFVRITDALVKAIGTRACVRRRPKRIQQKIDQRGGYLHHDCLGAYLHAEEGRSHGQ